MNFIEIEGASGARYRFRLLPDGSRHQPIPGNYAFVRQDREEMTVLLVGECIDLSEVQAQWPDWAPGRATHIFTRLNVPKKIRLAEHEDLAARHQSAATLLAAE
jgi:hypothetical protein